jgi:hypothetical protein
VREWLGEFGYGDSAEFIENIPFSETRDYVQAVLRNGQVYRELYGKERAVLASDVIDNSTVPPAKITNVAAVSKVVAKKPARVSVSARARARKATAKPVAVAAKPAASTKKSTAGHTVAAKKQKHAAA